MKYVAPDYEIESVETEDVVSLSVGNGAHANPVYDPETGDKVGEEYVIPDVNLLF